MSVPTQEEIKQIEQDIIAQGWTRQFTMFPARVREYIEIYEAAGLEVRVENWALTADADPSCNDCALIGIMRTIFTRRREVDK
ncbi:hypothetical protein ANRL3_01444 [Anaerolineae bacterium]|nr:hypothetical protein ANRL3_01444 [Anaerolineae bacterium]